MKTISLILFLLLAALASAGTLDPPKPKWAINGYILQLIDGGALIHAGRTNEYGMEQPEAGSNVFVRGKFPGLVDRDEVRITALPDGTYEYTAVSGAKATVRAFDLVTVTRVRR